MEYEWKHQRCHSCRIFGHSIDQCPRNIVPVTTTVENDGFQKVVSKHSNGSKTISNGGNKSGGQPLKSMFRYVPKGVGNTSMFRNGSGQNFGGNVSGNTAKVGKY